MTNRHTVIRASILLSCVLLACSCASKPVTKPVEESGYQYESTADARLVSSHVSGPVSRETRLVVRFVDEAASDAQVGKAVASGAVTLSPSASGDFVWADTRTIEFRPSRSLPRGTIYTMNVTPARIAARFKDEAAFHFTFSVMSQAMSVSAQGFQGAGTKNINDLVFKGVLTTADTADAAAVEKTLTVTVDGRKAAVAWSHEKREHAFTVSGIVKKTATQALLITADGGPLEAGKPVTLTYEVPAITEFKVLSVKAVETPERYVEISFSDPLLSTQDFRGFVSASPSRQLRFSAQESTLKVYALTDWGDSTDISVKKGIKNAAGAALAQDAGFTVSFQPMKPEVRFIGNGVIVPQKTGVTVPIETMNLNAITVEIQRIYSDRIGQFLQVSELTGGEELWRVGKTIWKKIVPIPYTPDRSNQWIRTALDLSPLITDGDHSLYRITMSFDVRMIEYPGAFPSEEQLMSFGLEDLPLTEPSTRIKTLGKSFWDAYLGRRQNQDQENYYEDYYNNRDNPYHPAFYSRYYYTGKPIWVSRNFLVSNLGMIAQADANGRLTVAVSNLLTAEPIGGASVTLYDYQLQKVSQSQTDSSGLVSIAAVQEAFLLTAETKTDIGYLKLTGASNLPVSHFDVSGQQVQQGVKGFIYVERGVWRPGDPIYLTFILMDKNKALPADHPVILKLYNPQGKLVRTVSKNDPVGNFYHFALATGADDPTGMYQAMISVGGVSFTKDISVETVKPNRLKIGIDFGKTVTQLTTSPATGSMVVAWLHGAPAGDMDADVNVQLTPMPTVFPDYKGWTFDDPVRTFKAESKEVFKGRLDSAGRARFTMNLTSQAIAPGMLNAAFKTRVFEPGGNINVDTFSMPFHPYTQYAGISIPDADRDYDWLDVDEPHTVKIALVNDQGKPVASGEVDVEVYEIGWRWWWDMHDDNIADYLGSKDYELVSSQRVKVTKGAAEWTLKFKERVWGRYLVRVRDTRGGHATGRIVYMRWPGWYYSSGEEGGDTASVLMFTADKESYTVGETAKITIPTPQAGRILVSIENNGTLLSTEWVEAKKDQTLYTLKITDRMSPNIYVHVSMIQPHGQTVNDRPIRMFGIIPILVVDPATRLSPVLATADSYEPDSTAKVSVSEAAGKAMTYTLAVVDEGLLNLTRFTTPDPWAQFYKRDALGVATFDVYGFVAAAYGGNLEKLLAVGGGEGGEGSEGRKANRFPPMVRFLGPFTLGAKETKTHTIDIPQYVGAVRVMVVAGSSTAFGRAEKEVTVKKPVMVYATLPRVVSVTEQFALPATVFALEPGITSVEVSVKTNGRLAVTGESRKTVKFSATGDQLVPFTLTAGNTPGLAVVEVTAAAGKIVSSQKIEIDVRVPSTPITTVDALVMSKGETKDQQIILPGLSGTNEVVLEVSKIAPINLEKRLRFLIHYPYGCIEQTTSSVFPQLYLGKIVELSPQDAAEVQRNVQAGVDRLQHFQTYSGGFGYWPGDGYASSWGSVYAIHFLLEAEKLGYVVPNAMKRSALSFLKSRIGAWSWDLDRGDYVQAYALFDLALAGEPDLGAMNRMREMKLPAEVRYKLAGAYALAGQKPEALRLVQGEIPPLTPYTELGGTFGSAMRDMAVLAEGLLETGSSEQAAPLITAIAKSLSEESWYSTQSTAYGLLVIGKYLSGWQSGEPVKISYQWNGKKESVETSSPVKRITLPLGEDTGTKQIRLTNESGGVVFVRILKTGQPALGAETAVSNGIRLSITYTDKDGNALDVTSLPQGTDIKAVITVENPTRLYYEELALTYMAPSGWEIVNPRFDGWVQDREKGFEYQDVRDDRVFTFFSLRGSRSKSITLMLNASYAGRFYLPQSKVEAMYDGSINAAEEGKWIRVNEAAQ